MDDCTMVQFSEMALRPAVGELTSALGHTGPTEPLVKYVVALAQFGAHTDLVGARGEKSLVEIALADAVVLARHPSLLAPPAWEIGAGGASLSVPLALMLADYAGEMIEPRQKRATFLRMAAGMLGLAKRLTVRQQRVEPDAAPHGVAGCALGRAVFGPDVWIPMAGHVVREGGAFVVLTTEPRALPPGFEVLAQERYALPFAGAQRVATWVAKRTTG